MTISWVHLVAFCSLWNIKKSMPVQFKYQSFMPFRSSLLFSAIFTTKGCTVDDKPWSTLLLFLGLLELRQGKDYEKGKNMFLPSLFCWWFSLGSKCHLYGWETNAGSLGAQWWFFLSDPFIALNLFFSKPLMTFCSAAAPWFFLLLAAPPLSGHLFLSMENRGRRVLGNWFILG